MILGIAATGTALLGLFGVTTYSASRQSVAKPVAPPPRLAATAQIAAPLPGAAPAFALAPPAAAQPAAERPEDIAALVRASIPVPPSLPPSAGWPTDEPEETGSVRPAAAPPLPRAAPPLPRLALAETPTESHVVGRTAVPAPKPARLPAAEPPAASRDRVVVKRSGVFLRAGPSRSAAIVKTEKPGAVLSVYARKNQWVQVGDGRPIGWAYEGLVSKTP